MTKFSRGKAEFKGTMEGGKVLDCISAIRQMASETYERKNGPTLHEKMTDSVLGIEGLINDLLAAYDRHEQDAAARLKQ